MKDFKISHIFPRSDKFYGIYRGVVENRFDPEKRGRVQVRVFGLHSENRSSDATDGIPVSNLPWFEPALSLFGGNISGFGSWTVPLQGSHVYVFFENGNITQPRYFASSPGIEMEKPDKNKGFSDPEGIYPTTVREKRQDHHPLFTDDNEKDDEAKNNTILKYKKEHLDEDVSIASCNDDDETWSEPQPFFYDSNEKYPYNTVVTLGGILVEFDTTPKAQRLHIYHPSNTYIEISKDGKMIIRNDNDKYEIIKKSKYTHIAENSTTTIDNEKKEKIGGRSTNQIESNYCRKVGGDENINIKGSRTVKAGSTIKIKGSDIFLN